MKKKSMISLLVTLALLLGLLAGCGATSKETVRGTYSNSSAAPADTVETAEGALEYGDMDSTTALPESRKWIITVDLSAETEDLDTLLTALTAHISALEGYVEDQNIYNGSAYSSRRYRYANLTVRIPAAQVDDFTQDVAGLANVVSNNKSLEDVTLQYTDTETRIAALETEKDRLLELMEQAETMADLLEIESRLTQVRYELESYSAKLRLYDNQIDYATIYLNIEEVQEYTPVQELTVWQKITTGFVGSIKGLWNGFVDVMVWILVNSPYILVFGGIAVLAIALVGKHCKRRKEKNVEEKENT